MTIHKNTEMTVNQKFDPKTCRHSIDGAVQVLHCHHYATLYCQLADDAEMFDGKALLRKAAEMSFVPMLKKLMTEAGATTLAEKISIAEQYWKFSGMGRLEFKRVGSMSAAAAMPSSHVDEGWIKKWGKRTAPVNFIGQGYISAAMAAVFDLPVGSFAVQETKSIVSGAEASQFCIVRQ